MSLDVACVICDAPISLPADTVEDELLECPECGSELVVASLTPPLLEEAPQTEEDWGE
ncbi:MAG TPA: lysine biosynthesis protein LysW [Caldithrix abyssi]|uniref:Lysine biosynthesis protein LysW n=1 Tax=Caldithrix abyssi TaxID=187145 RepID=A0A7V1PTP0_CALAY|nr:lysine biosynthesis protein LysW [Caldithrix abyssi]